MQRKACGILCGLLVAVAASAPAQNPTSASEGRRLVVPVNVVDRRGDQVGGLTAEDFRASVSRQAATVVSVAPDSAPRRVVLVLDLSLSLFRDPGQEKTVREAAESLLGWLGQDSTVAVIAFSDEVKHRAEFRPAGEARGEVLLALGRSAEWRLGQTRLLDALSEALAMLEPGRLGDAIYAITDGVDTGSRATELEVKKALACSGVRLFALTFYPAPGVAPRQSYGRVLVGELTEWSGGSSVALWPGQGLTPEAVNVLRRLYDQMQWFYRVEVELGEAEPSTLGREWKLEVTGQKQRGWTVMYPRRLVACEAEEPVMKPRMNTDEHR
ncbi:MAG: VWA domain-containing protein [Acidobacteria bacterium]|nr:VWA domain-containing protein [Acidobacteriota bacterium]